MAFSGGPDSCAALLAASRLASDRSADINVVALHVDHRLDSGSSRRAQRAEGIAAQLGVPFVLLEPPLDRTPGESPEEAARRRRYLALETIAGSLDLDCVLLGHHRDDQVETVLMRWLAGSTLVGLGGMSERVPSTSGRPFLRPLLEWRRQQLVTLVQSAGIEPIADPTNTDLGVPRNRLRSLILPRLDPEVSALALSIAHRARSLRARLQPILTARLDPAAEPDGASVNLAALRALPSPLLPFALQLLAEHAGRNRAPRSSVRADLARRLADPSPLLRIDAGDGWRLERHGRRLCLLAPGRVTRPFAYTLRVPGVREIPEIEASVRIRPAPPDVRPTDLLGGATTLTLPDGADHRFVVRSRRPGDRFRPLGSDRALPLRTLLIDWQVRRDLRDRLPLLEVDGEIAWIAGIAIAERFRPTGDVGVRWIVELLPDAVPHPEPHLGRKGIS